MRKFLIILLSLLICSCSVNKKKNISYDGIKDISCPVKNIEPNNIDTTAIEPVVGSSQPEELKNYTNDVANNVVKSSNVESNKSLNTPINGMNIIDYTDISKSKNTKYGMVAYNIPSKFTVNKYSTIKLRISKHSGKIESIIIGDRRIPIVSNDDNVIVETIEVDTLMTAKLFTDSKAFEVELTSNQEQKVSDNGYTEWVWRVRPLKSGEHYLKLLITISGKDIVVYEKNIPVESNWEWSFSNWFKEWWQLIMTTVITPFIIPLVIRWWNNRKKDKEKDEKV